MKDFGALMLKEDGVRDSPTGNARVGAPSTKPGGSILKRKGMLLPWILILCLVFLQDNTLSLLQSIGQWWSPVISLGVLLLLRWQG